MPEPQPLKSRVRARGSATDAARTAMTLSISRSESLVCLILSDLRSGRRQECEISQAT